eukprot:1597992-Rhodomonas_salina.1
MACGTQRATLSRTASMLHSVTNRWVDAGWQYCIHLDLPLVCTLQVETTWPCVKWILNDGTIATPALHASTRLGVSRARAMPDTLGAVCHPQAAATSMSATTWSTSSQDNCHTSAACINTVRSFTCSCNAGYSGS